MRLRVAFRTLGCKVNQVESERTAAALLGFGAELAEEPDADIVVINTCTVTGEADRKARKEVRRALRLPREPVVVVTGCLAALDADGLRAISPRVVVEADKDTLAGHIAELLGIGRGAGRGDVAAAAGMSVVPALGQGAAGIASADPAGTLLLPSRADTGFRTRAMLKVEDGCDNYCAYCIVPYARGLPRAVPLRRVVSEAETLVAGGTAEIVLTGINIGRYDDNGADLADLVRAVAGTGVRRLRLSSIEPVHLTSRVLEALAGTRAVCPHLHVPLQSGSDHVLRAMDRAYDTSAFAAVIAEARAAIPGLALSTDVMVGFPGETPADSIATASFVERCGFMRLHVFRYSRRPGTLASEMPGQVDPRDKAIRAQRLRDTGTRLAAAYAASRAGGTVSVLVEKVSGGRGEGTSADYLKARFSAGDARPGDVVELVVSGADASGGVTARW
jgi:threonylcarbamoyladenosine tRNA methylthiotransferase MtaB